jgi:Hemolysin activation/secretion protein
MTFKAFLAAATVLSVLPAAFFSAAAQTIPNYNIGDALREAAPPKPPVEKPEAVPVLPRVDDEPLSLPDGGRLFVRDFRLEGAEFMDEADLQVLLEPYKGRDLSLAEIFEAANRITVFYRERGYMVAKAHVPKQDARSGTLTIKVVVGRYGLIEVENSSVVHGFLVEGALDTARGEDGVVTAQGLERAMLLVSDMPGAQMPKLTIAPGTEPGTSDFVAAIEGADRLDGYVLADNFGSRYIGRNRVNAAVNVNAPLGLADRLSVSVTNSEAAGLQNGRVSYSFPLSYDGLRAEVSAARTTYKLGDIYSDLDATGVANTWEGTLSYPVIRSRAETVTVSLNVARKRLRDKIFGLDNIPKDAQTTTLGMNRLAYGSLLGLPLMTTVQSAVTLGRLDFVNSADETANKAGADTAGTYSKLLVGGAGTLALDQDWSLAVGARGQRTLRDKNLDGSEQMSISGPNGARGYAEGVSGDNGYLLSSELRYALPQRGDLRHTLGVFAEMGRVHAQNNEYTGEGTGTRINDIGVSYSANFEYSEGRYLTGTVLATRVLGPQQQTGEKTGKGRVLAQVGILF